jgi:hypothetical protein
LRRAERPIRVVADTPILPFMHAQRTAGVICAQAQHGIIVGIMDHHVAISWVNQWALCVLAEAAYAARELGRAEDAASFTAEHSGLKMALEEYIARTPEYFDWERTVNSVLWPSRVWEDDPEGATALRRSA